MRPAILIDKTDASFSESFAEYGTVLQMQKNQLTNATASSILSIIAWIFFFCQGKKRVL